LAVAKDLPVSSRYEWTGPVDDDVAEALEETVLA
jgi:hypothetical protein